MKGLRKCLTPFAPDQSGAVSVLYELGGIIVVVDAGGCTGNICGFDEPRWQNSKSAIFSAGLRDMDAILGRDRLLVSKIVSAADRIEARFVAIVGTPVPATIATDYKALKRMLEKQIDLPVITIETNGMRLYDVGETMAYKALIEEFRDRERPSGRNDSKLILGATPLTYGNSYLPMTIEDYYGIDSGIEAVAASTSGIEACKVCGLKYTVECNMAHEYCEEGRLRGRVLVVHDEAFGLTIKNRYKGYCETASFFAHGQRRLDEEDDFTRLVREGGFDTIVADSCLVPLVPFYHGAWVDAPCFAISGRLL